jgi:hypothetical protein
MKTQASVESLQFEIDNLIAQKQQLEALPKVISDPLKYAQAVAQKVSESAPKVRQIDSLIDGLQNLIRQRQAESEAERQQLKDESDKAELESILSEFKTLGDKLDAIAKIEAKTLLELKKLHEVKGHRLWQLTQRHVQYETVHNPIDYSPIGDGNNPGLQRSAVKVFPDNLIIIQKRSDTLQSILEG